MFSWPIIDCLLTCSRDPKKVETLAVHYYVS